MKSIEDNESSLTAPRVWPVIDDGQKITYLDYGLLHASATNPRKKFEEGPLLELRDSILAEGIISPLIVRESKTAPGLYEIGAGERRWRACKAALEQLGVMIQDPSTGEEEAMALEARAHTLQGVPCIVRVMSDAQFMALQLIENLQRKDLSPLEEADAYEAALGLRDEAGKPVYTMEGLAQELGRKYKDIQRARKWSRLTPLARRAFELGIGGKEHATLIAQIPGYLERRVATLEILFQHYPEDPVELDEQEAALLKMLDKADADELVLLKDEVVSVPSARDHVAAKYRASLKGCGFGLADGTLLMVEMDGEERVAGGACEDCPMRTGRMPEFDGEIQDSRGEGGGTTGGMDPLVCTNPGCLRRKVSASASRQLEEAKAQGLTMVPAEECGKMFEPHGNHALVRGSKWVALLEKPGYELLGHVNDAKAKTWEKLLNGLDVAPELAVDPMGRPRLVVLREKAVLAVNVAALKNGKESPFVAAQNEADRPPKVERSVLSADESELTKLVEVQRDAAKDLQKQRKDNEDLEKKTDGAASIEALRKVYPTMAKGIGIEGLWFMVGVALTRAQMDGLQVLAAWLGLELVDDKCRKLDQEESHGLILAELRCRASNPQQVGAVLFIALISQQVGWQKCKSPWLVAACEMFGVDLQAVFKGTKGVLREAKKVKSGKVKSEKGAEPRKPEMKSKSGAAKRGQASVDRDERDAETRSGGDGETGEPEQYTMFEPPSPSVGALSIVAPYEVPAPVTLEEQVMDHVLHRTQGMQNVKRIQAGESPRKIINGGGSEPVFWTAQGRGISFLDAGGVECWIPWKRVVARAKQHVLTGMTVVYSAARDESGKTALAEVVVEPPLPSTLNVTVSAAPPIKPPSKKNERALGKLIKAGQAKKKVAAKKAAKKVAKKKGGKK